MNINDKQVISIKQEEAIQQILNEYQGEVGSDRYQLDADIEDILKQSQDNIAVQYQEMAENMFNRNRMAIQIHEDEDFLQNILQTEVNKHNQHKQQQLQIQEIVNISQPQEYVLDQYETNRVTQSKLQQQEIISLDNKYPKINHMSMIKYHFPIFNLSVSTTSKYLNYKRIPLYEISFTVTIHMSNEEKWTILAIGQLLVVFTSQKWKQPITIMPMKNKNITYLTVSSCKKFLAVGLQNQVLVYMIRGQSLVLLKHFCEIGIQRICKMVIYTSSPIRIAVLDNEEYVWLITIEQGMLFTTSNVRELNHCLQLVLDIDLLVLNKKHYIGLVSRNSVCVYMSQPSIQYMVMQQLQQITRDVKIRWRMNAHLNRPQLLVGYDKKILIYKYDGANLLDMHLSYTNHYDIVEMELISDMHILIRSHQNIIVIAIPLIPSTSIDEETEVYENAIVYITSYPNLHLMHVSYDEIVFFSNNEEQIKIAKLRTLDEYLNQLMIQKGCFREAFILLILVYKGVNYSFKFTYLLDDLCSSIYKAIQNGIASLVPALDQNIIQFRVGWVCQLSIQTRQQHLIWSLIFKKLKHKKLQNILFNILQLFILRSQIKNIPQDIFFHGIKLYCQFGHDSVVQKMIINNRQPYDGGKLLSLIQLTERYYLTLFLFSKGIISDQSDFFTPFVKVFSSFKLYYERGDKAKYQQIGTICLWYLRQCFMLQQIPSGIMTLEEKICVTTDFLIQTLQTTFIKRLSQFNMNVFLQTYLLLFMREQFIQLIRQYNQLLVHKYRQYYNNILNPQELKNTQFHQILLLHFRKNINVKKYQLLWSQFQSLAFYYCMCMMTFESMVDILIILFQNKFSSFSLKMPSKMVKPSIQLVYTKIINYIKPILLTKKDRFYMNKLLSFGDPTINYLLHKIDQNYKLSLQNYLVTKPKERLISFIYQVLEDWQKIENDKGLRERKKQEIKQFLVKNMSLLFRIQKNEALSIFYMIGQTTQSIYHIIEQNLSEKINFLTAVLLKYKDEEFGLKQKFLLDHLSEVCQLNEAQMRQYLNTFFYPLDQAIRVCEQKGNLIAKAILQQRAGDIDGAFRSYERLIRNMIYGKESQKSIRKNVQEYVEECIRLCKQFSDETSTENYWLRIIKFINSFIISNNQHKIYLKVEFQKILQFVLNEIFEFLPTTLLIGFFTNPKNKLQLSLSKQFGIFSHLFINIKLQISISRKVIDVCKLDIKDSKKGALVHKRVGLLSFGQCDFCKNKLSQENETRVYYCSHSFHLLCHDDKYKCLTCYYESQDSIVSANIYGSHMRKTSYEWQPRRSQSFTEVRQIIVQSQAAARHEKNKKRLKLFEFEQNKKDYQIFKLNTPDDKI